MPPGPDTAGPPARRLVIITFACSSSPRPIGGVTALYEFANALSRRGHEVHVVHARFFGCRIDSLDDISWFTFDPAIVHHIATTEVPTFPPAEVIFGTGAPAEAGLPVHLVQGIDMLQPWLEREAFRARALKVCVARWLVRSGAAFGVAEDQFHVVHMGIDHDRYRVLDPATPRPVHVAMLHHAHEAKGTAVGLAALAEVRRQRPDLRVALFGTAPPDGPLPEGTTFVLAPRPEELVRDVYNRSRVFLQPSEYEGFGVTAVEAMACGCALVTTDNGGSDDYAEPGVTALVAPPGDVAGLAGDVTALLDDDQRRRRLAEAGRRRALGFDWAVAGREMEALLARYLADPEPFRRPPEDDTVPGHAT